MSKALARAINEEFRLLYDCEARFKIPAAPVTRQLDEQVTRRLPNVLPDPPRWENFKWPSSGSVDLRAYWQRTEWNPWKIVQ